MAIITKHLNGDTPDYSDIALWESTENTDLAADGDSHVLKFWGVAPMDTAATLVIDGWGVTNATNNITIEPGADFEGWIGSVKTDTDGRFSAGSFKQDQLIINQAYTTIRGLNIKSPTTPPDGTYSLITVGVDAEGTLIDRCRFDSNNNIDDTNTGIEVLSTGTATVLIRRCRIDDLDYGIEVGTDYCTIDNCLIKASDLAGIFLRTGFEAKVRNTVCYDGTTDFDENGGAFSTGTSNNASGDTSSPGANSVTGVTFSDFWALENVPDPTGLLWEAGIDLSAEHTIDCRNRTVVHWCIGAYDDYLVSETLKTSGGDYSSLSLWESDTQQRTAQASANNLFVLTCSSGTYLEPTILFDSRNLTNLTYNRTVQVAVGSEHNGVYGTGVQLKCTTNAGSANFLDIREDYFTLSGISAEYNFTNTNANNSTIAGEEDIINDQYIQVTVRDCLTKGSSGTGSYGIRLLSMPSWQVFNCIVSDSYFGIGMVGGTDDQDKKTLNCLARNCVNAGFAITENTKSDRFGFVQNCVAYGTTTGSDFATNNEAWATGTSNNASEDGTAPGTSPVTGVVAGDFLDYAGGDYTAAIGGALDDTGIDQSTYFDNDIAGTAR